jgi:hypothetical protein
MDIEPLINEIENNDSDVLSKKLDTSDAKEIQNIDKLENYYFLKNVYSENVKTQKNRSFLNLDDVDNKNWKLKKSLLKTSKPKCVNCKRNVGTIFSNSYNLENKSRILIAKCGDIESPCGLNIELLLNPVYLLDEQLRVDKKELSSNQDKIIRTKNDLLFGYLPEEEALNFFESITGEIETNTKNVELNLYKFLNITHNTKKIEKITELKHQFYENIKEFKGFISNFEKDKNLKHIQNANEYYEHNILQTIKELNKLKYAYSNVDHDANTNKKSLIQKEYTTDMIEDFNGNDMIEVIHYSIDNAVNVDQEMQQQQQREPVVQNIQDHLDTNAPSTKIKKIKRKTTVKLNASPLVRTMKNREPLTETPKLRVPETVDNATIFRAMDEMKANIPAEELGALSLKQFVERLENEYGFSNLMITHKKVIKNYLLAPEFEI